MALEERFEEWVHKQLLTVPIPYSFKLRHAGDTEDRSERIAELKLPPNYDGKAELAATAIVGETLKWARQHSDSFGTTQRYKVSVLRRQKGSNRLASGDQFHFSLRGRARETEVGASDPPTMGGLLGQLMRHNEATARLAIESMGSVVAALETQNTRFTNELRSMHEHAAANRAAVEELLTKKLERDLMISEHDEEKRRSELVQKQLFEVVLPAIGKHLLPQTHAPQGSGTKRVLTILGALPKEQQAKLEEVLREGLSEEQRTELMATLMAG